MILRYRYASSQADSLAAVIDSLPDAAIAVPTRSTVPLLRYWRKPEIRLAAMASALNRRFPEVLTLAFEYATPVRDGRGKASFTDLMLLGESISVAIEAKYTEPQYQSTNEWLGTEPSDNRRRVLAGWLAAIKEAAGADITERVGDLPYQLIHRTASVCCAPGPDRMLIYQVFGHNPPAHYSDAMVALDRLLGPNSCVGFYLHTCPYEPTGIWAPRPRGASALMTAAQIRKALLADPEDLEPGTLIPVAA